MSLRDLVDSTPVSAETGDSMTKIISAADALMEMPSPVNARRSRDHIVDFPVILILSKTTKTPDFIAAEIEKSDYRELLDPQANRLIGLCLNGRDLPVVIFIHLGQMVHEESWEELFEEYFWHEFMHGAEGIYRSGDEIKRKTPWSYLFQQKLLRLDDWEEKRGDGERKRFDTDQLTNRLAVQHLHYLYSGLDIQQNVSELFARVGVLMLQHIRECGTVPRTPKAVYDLLAARQVTPYMHKPAPECGSEADDLWHTLGMHGGRAQVAFWRHVPKMMQRAAKLYGCDIG